MLSFVFGAIIGGSIGALLTACFVRSGELSRQEEMYYSRIWREENEKDNC
jgi:hypothetical protein